MKYVLRVPTKETYAYIEAEMEGTADEAVLAYNDLTRAVLGGTGVGIKELAKICIELVRGGIQNGGNYEFSATEGLLIKEMTKLLREEKR